MTRFLKVLSVLLLSHFNVVSQTFNGSIKGQQTGSPIPFSSIYILDLEIGIIADSAGNFNAKNSLPSQIKAKFSFREIHHIIRQLKLCLGGRG